MRMLLAVSLLLVPSLAFAADKNSPGPSTWTWNAKESVMPADMPAPKSMVLKITKDDGTHTAWSMTMVDAKGKSHTMSWSGAYDGKERPVKGGGTFGITKTGDDSVKITAKEKDGSTMDESCSISSDKKKMTCKGTMKDKDGKSADYTDVYDRT